MNFSWHSGNACFANDHVLHNWNRNQNVPSHLCQLNLRVFTLIADLFHVTIYECWFNCCPNQLNFSYVKYSHNIVSRSNVLVFISFRIFCDSWEFSCILAAVSLSLLSLEDSIFSYNSVFYLYKYVCKNSISLSKYQFLQQ